jgi:DNA invertase Pin-like site-specific DNA recombinase
MNRWILYARTSTNRQEKGLEAQVRALKAFAEQKGVTEYDVFSDEGISGAKASRPSLDQAMQAIRARKYEGIIVYSFSRFARSTKHLLEALDEFQTLNVGFISLSESIDTKSAIGKALFTIISAISQLERELISERVKNGLNNAIAKGKLLGRKRTRNSLLIRELASKNYSYRKIAKLVGCSTTTVHRELTSVPKTSASKANNVNKKNEYGT